MRRYHLESYITYLEKYQITEVAMVNVMVKNLLGMPEGNRKLLSSLRLVLVGGAPLEASVQNRLSNILHEDASVGQVWGLTEAGWITASQFPEKDNTGSAGRLLADIKARYAKRNNINIDQAIVDTFCRVVDTELKDITDDGTLGEILIQSPSIMTSYLKNPDATNSTILGGWLRTGDIGYQKNEKWYIVDRAKVRSPQHHNT